jgi:signal transduction histidine kinase
LRNIQNRAEVLNGTFKIESGQDVGSAVTVFIPKD